MGRGFANAMTKLYVDMYMLGAMSEVRCRIEIQSLFIESSNEGAVNRGGELES